MSLTECPECGGQVSTDASSCPHCGYTPRQQQQRPAPQPQQQNDSGSAFSTGIKATMGVLFALFLVFVAGPVMCCGGGLGLFGEQVNEDFEEAEQEVEEASEDENY